MTPQRLRIRIKRPLGEIVVHRRVERDGISCIVWKEKKDRPEWKFTFDRNCVYPTKKMFLGGKQDTVDAFPFSTEAVSYDYRADEELQPIYDRTTEDKLVRSKVMKDLGEGDEFKTPTLTWIILGAVVINAGLTFMIYLRGRI